MDVLGRGIPDGTVENIRLIFENMISGNGKFDIRI